MTHSLTLAQPDLGFTQFADNLFGGVSLSWYLTLLPCLILTLQLN